MRKHILFFSFVVLSLSVFSQARILTGLKPGTSQPGWIYRDTLRPQYFSSPLYAANDSTAAIDTSKFTVDTFAPNLTNDSLILTFLNGRRLAAKAASAGGGGGSAAGATTYVQYNDGGSFAGSSRFTFYPANGVNITGGKDTVYQATAHEEAALTATTSANTIAAIKLILKNTYVSTGKQWELRSVQDGSFDIMDRAVGQKRFGINTSGQVTLGTSGTYTSLSGLTVTNGNIDITAGGLKVTGSPASGFVGAGLEIEYGSGQSYLSSADRSAGFTVKPLSVRTSGMIVAQNGTPNTSLLFDVSTTAKASRPAPPMTQAQRDAISSLATWAQVICTDCTATDGSTGVLQVWNGSAWKNAW